MISTATVGDSFGWTRRPFSKRPYDGQLDAARRVLTLDSEGPSFAGDGTMAKYQDIVEIVDENRHVLYSRFQNQDGTWTEFMKAKYTRVSH